MIESGHSTKPALPTGDARRRLAINGYKTMQAGWVLLYFLLGCVALAVLVFPAGARGLWSKAGWPWQQVCGLAQRSGRRAWSQADRQRRQLTFQVRAGASQAREGWRARWPSLLLTLALLTLPLALVLLWNQHAPRVLEGYDDRIDPANQQVSSLLQGEQLVPPPPLPPELFATAELEDLRPMLQFADRRWNQMDADFVQRLLLAFRIMKQTHGYDMALLEGWRSPERQTLLAARGANVTMAGAWQSYHQYGLAADCAFYRNGKLLISEKDPWAMRGYQLYGEVAESLGLTWGGRWQMLDLGHVEWRKPGSRSVMRARRAD
jgi:peptidoglycan L-alanyl-D-glutamate endopeptidase CwlK